MLIASKDRAGSHMAGVADPGVPDSVGTSGLSWESGGDPKGDRCADANIRRNVMLLSIYMLSKHSQTALS